MTQLPGQKKGCWQIFRKGRERRDGCWLVFRLSWRKEGSVGRKGRWEDTGQFQVWISRLESRLPGFSFGLKMPLWSEGLHRDLAFNHLRELTMEHWVFVQTEELRKSRAGFGQRHQFCFRPISPGIPHTCLPEVLWGYEGQGWSVSSSVVPKLCCFLGHLFSPLEKERNINKLYSGFYFTHCSPLELGLFEA